MSHRFQPLSPKHPRTCPRTIRTSGGDHLYLNYAELRHDSPRRTGPTARSCCPAAWLGQRRHAVIGGEDGRPGGHDGLVEGICRHIGAMPFLSIAVPGRRDRNTGCGSIAQRRRGAVLHQRRARPVPALRSVMTVRSPMPGSRAPGVMRDARRGPGVAGQETPAPSSRMHQS